MVMNDLKAVYLFPISVVLFKGELIVKFFWKMLVHFRRQKPDSGEIVDIDGDTPKHDLFLMPI